MKKLSLKQRIINYFQKNQGKWINGGEVERLALSIGYKSSNASRRLRELESGKLSNGQTCEKILENKIDNKTVWYRYLPQEKTKIVPIFNNGSVILTEKKVYI